MGYVASLEDLPALQKYTPSLEDLPSSQINNNTDYLSNLKSLMKPNSALGIAQQEEKQSPFQIGTTHGLKNLGYQTLENIDKVRDYLTGSQSAPQVDQQLKQLQSDPNYLAAVKQSPFFAKAGNIAGGALPYAAALPVAGAASLPWWGRMALQSGIGGVTSQVPLLGAGLGALTEGGSNLISKMGTNLINKFNLSNLPYYAEKVYKAVGQDIKPVPGYLNSLNNHVFDRAAVNEGLASGNETLQWTKLNNAAKQVDPNFNVNRTSYISGLGDQLNDIDASLKVNPLLPELQDARNQTIGWALDNPQNLTDLINHGKGLNFAYRRPITPGIDMPQSNISNAIRLHKNNLQENLESNGLLKQLGPSIDDANNATKYLNKTFYEVTDSAGNPKTSRFASYVKNPTSPDRGNFVQSYLPKSPSDGIGNMQRFSDMVGDKDLAKEALIKNLFSGANTDADILSKFNTLGDDQAYYLFGPSKVNAFKKMNDIQMIGKRSYNAPSSIAAGVGKNLVTRLPGTSAAQLLQQQPISFLNQNQK